MMKQITQPECVDKVKNMLWMLSTEQLKQYIAKNSRNIGAAGMLALVAKELFIRSMFENSNDKND